MKESAVEQLARTMYGLASINKHQFFRKSYDPDGTGRVIPWKDLAFEKELWTEMASIAMAASEKLVKEIHVKETE